MNKRLESAIRVLCIECGFKALSVYAPAKPGQGQDAEIMAILVAKDVDILKAAAVDLLTKEES